MGGLLPIKSPRFWTTHSHECVVAAHQAVGAELQLLRLEATAAGHQCVSYSEEALAGAMALRTDVCPGAVGP